MEVPSKLPNIGQSIFSTISALSNQNQAINLGQGFPNFAMDEALIHHVNEAMNKGHNQYSAMIGIIELRKIIKAKLDITQGIKIDEENEITITAGASQALFTAIIAFIKPGDEVLLFEPMYDAYAPAIALCGGVCSYITLLPPEFAIDWDNVKKKISSKTKMIITNTPNNPTGCVLSNEDCMALAEIVYEHKLILLSDEVYEHLVFDGAKHLSALRLSKIYNQTLAVFSFGKTLHCTGWKIGYIVGSPYLMKEFRKIHQFNAFCVATPMQVGIATYLLDANTYLGLSEFYQKKRDTLYNAMLNTRFDVLQCKGTFFQLYAYDAISKKKDIDFAIELIEDYKVATIPLSSFYTTKLELKYLRFCFAKTDETIDNAVKQLILL